MKLGYSLALMASGLALGVNACDYPEFKFSKVVPDAGTSSGGQGGGLGGNGGSGAGGTGGGQPACSPVGKPGDCPPSTKCTVVDTVMGTADCVPYGSTPDFQACTSTEQCGAFSWCDEPTGVCRPVCTSAGECFTTFGLGIGTLCGPTVAGGSTVMGGLQVCTAHCNPQDNLPCVTGGTNPVTCAWRSSPSPGDWDCIVSGGAGEGAGCAESWDCQPGLTCGAYDHTCQPWCTTPGCCCTQCVVGVCGP